jgi:hypothetical protein
MDEKRLANRFILIVSGHGASQGAARPPRPTFTWNPTCADRLSRPPELSLTCRLPARVPG